MTSSKKSMVTAIAPFGLIAVTLVSGLAWATASTYQLAKKNVSDEYRARLDVALRRIESRVLGVLNSEAARPYTDYAHRYEAQPDVVRFDRRTLDPDRTTVGLPSPLAQTDPPYHWMDLHFQIDTTGAVSSPQIPDLSLAWPVDRSGMSEETKRRSQETWEWLEKALLKSDIAGEVAASFARCQTAEGSSIASIEGEAQQAIGDEVARSRGKRGDLLDEQRGYLPPEECFQSTGVRTNAPGDGGRNFSIFNSVRGENDGPVNISLGPFAPPFWIAGTRPENPKLLFVREVYADAQVFYQGFVGDWEHLKPQLIAEVSGLFPEADIVPVANDALVEPSLTRVRLRQVPAVLKVAGLPGGLAATAWRTIQSQVYMSWAAAAAVLVAAAWGVWTLVALADRRMQFAYAVTHELRTPLTTFRLYSDMLSAGLVPESSKAEYLDTLNTESIRLATLVESVLEYARLENQKVKLHLERTDGPSLLKSVGEMLELRCRENCVEPKLLNHVANGTLIRTDINLVNQIAGVLVNNAVRHARGNESALVLVELAVDGGRIHLDVADSGPGIAAADARHIFKPFRRGSDADTSARGGVGLGLALAKNWANLLGGRLELASRHHPTLDGAHFRLTIPTEPPGEV